SDYRSEIKMSILLFRAVSDAELFDIKVSGKLQACPNSLEGKFLAETPEDAEKWGRLLNGQGKFRIIAVELPRAEADKLMRWERLDGIGPARFAELEELTKAVITVVQ